MGRGLRRVIRLLLLLLGAADGAVDLDGAADLALVPAPRTALQVGRGGKIVQTVVVVARWQVGSVQGQRFLDDLR